MSFLYRVTSGAFDREYMQIKALGFCKNRTWCILNTVKYGRKS